MNDVKDMTDNEPAPAEGAPVAPAPAPAEDAPQAPALVPADEQSPPEPEAPADAALAEAVDGGLTWVPFALYLGCWIALAGASAYLLGQATPDTPARWMPAYAPLVIAGVALAALGPAMSLVVWLVARSRRSPERRRGLLASALTRGSLAAFFGAMVWIVTLYLLEILSGSAAW